MTLVPSESDIPYWLPGLLLSVRLLHRPGRLLAKADKTHC
jgi:hypothetical protein